MVLYTDVFKVTALLNVAEGFISPPAGEVDFDNTPDGLLNLHFYGTACEEHHGDREVLWPERDSSSV